MLSDRLRAGLVSLLEGRLKNRPLASLPTFKATDLSYGPGEDGAPPGIGGQLQVGDPLGRERDQG